MKVHYNEILQDLDCSDRELSLLVTIAEGTIDWNSIPNSVLEIVNERSKRINFQIKELFDLLETYQK